MLPLICRFRGELRYIRISDVFMLAKPIAVVFLPERIADLDSPT